MLKYFKRVAIAACLAGCASPAMDPAPSTTLAPTARQLRATDPVQALRNMRAMIEGVEHACEAGFVAFDLSCDFDADDLWAEWDKRRHVLRSQGLTLD